MADSIPARQTNGVPAKSRPDDVPAPIIVYPADYTFKIMGASADDFPDHATGLVAQVVGAVAADKVSTRLSKEGKYQSVSVSVRLLNEDQRRAVYQNLWEDKRVLYYL